ncbi:hypothetical protein ABK040_013628 [Willaertia magna]
MKVVPVISKEQQEKNELKKVDKHSVSTSNNNKTIENDGIEQGIKFYRSISCCLTMLISLSIVLSILFITAVWVSTFSASLITLADSNRRNEFNKLETYFRQTIKGIENFGQTASGVLSKELQFYDLNKTESLMFSLWKAQYLNTKGNEYFIFIVDEDGIALGFARPDIPDVYGAGVYAMLAILHPDITGTQLHFYFCNDFFNKNYCDRKPFGKPDLATDISGSNLLLYYMALPYLGNIIWTPTYSDVATPGLLHLNMLTAFNTTYTNNKKKNAVFAYDFAASSMNIYLNESTLHLPGAVVFVIETSTGHVVATINSDHHGLKGCNIATSLIEKLPQLKITEETSKGPLPFTIHCAVVTDSVACEWMYEMEQKESKNKWNNYNAGYDLYLDGKYEEALKKFKEHLSINPNDKIGKKMIEICQY